MFEDAITPLDWLWEPEITAELDSQVQALVNRDTDPAAAGKPSRRFLAEAQLDRLNGLAASTEPRTTAARRVWPSLEVTPQLIPF